MNITHEGRDLKNEEMKKNGSTALDGDIKNCIF